MYIVVVVAVVVDIFEEGDENEGAGKGISVW